MALCIQSSWISVKITQIERDVLLQLTPVCMPQNITHCGWRGNLHHHADLFCYYMFFEIINSLQKMNLPYVYTQPFSIWLNGQFLFYRDLDFTLLNHAEWRDLVPK